MGLNVQKIEYEEIEQYIQELYKNVFIEKLSKIKKIVEEKEEVILDEFRKAIDNVLLQSKEKQDKNIKGKIKHICIFGMNYYYYTKKNPILIYAFDDRGYLDKTECVSSVELDCIFNYYLEDILIVEKEVKKKFMRVDEELIEKALRKLLFDYFFSTYSVLILFTNKLLSYVYSSDCLKEEEVRISVGSYMDKCVCLNQLVNINN